MVPRDLLQLAELALAGPANPQLFEDLLRTVVEVTGSRAGDLRRGEHMLSRWPRTASRRGDDSREGWTEVQFGDDGDAWQVGLAHPERLDEAVMNALRISLRAISLRDELKRTRFDERFHLWELETIRAIATDIGGILDLGQLSQELINHLVALLGVRSAHIYLGPSAAEGEIGAGFGPEVLDASQLEAAWTQEVYRDEVMAIPLVGENGVLGLLVAANKEARAGTEPFGGNDLRLMELFAIQVTMAMEFARLTRESLERERLRRELEVAAEIQSHLHPQDFPSFEGFRLAASSSPSRQVAGDTYDVLVEDCCLIATVTDVSGKGVGAGMIASGIHAAVRLLSETEPSLDSLAKRVNDYLVGATEDNRFATFAMIRMSKDGSLAAVNAGHCPVLIRRHDGVIEQINSSGLPLGIMSTASYRESARVLEPGDLLLLYTDGLTEAENPEDEEFGVDRVEEVVARLDAPTAESACRDLLRAVDEFVCGRPLADDATLLVVERLAE